MTKDEVITHFWEFLFETGAACEYVGMTKENHGHVVRYINARATGGLLTGAFIWEIAPSGNQYWFKIDTLWRIRLGELSGYRGAK